MKSTPDERETFRKKQTGKDFSKKEVVKQAEILVCVVFQLPTGAFSYLQRVA